MFWGILRADARGIRLPGPESADPVQFILSRLSPDFKNRFSVFPVQGFNPEADKLILLSQKLNISLDSLLGNEGGKNAANPEGGASRGAIRIISPVTGCFRTGISSASASPVT